MYVCRLCRYDIGSYVLWEIWVSHSSRSSLLRYTYSTFFWLKLLLFIWWNLTYCSLGNEKMWRDKKSLIRISREIHVQAAVWANSPTRTALALRIRPLPRKGKLRWERKWGGGGKRKTQTLLPQEERKYFPRRRKRK